MPGRLRHGAPLLAMGTDVKGAIPPARQRGSLRRAQLQTFKTAIFGLPGDPGPVLGTGTALRPVHISTAAEQRAAGRVATPAVMRWPRCLRCTAPSGQEAARPPDGERTFTGAARSSAYPDLTGPDLGAAAQRLGEAG